MTTPKWTHKKYGYGQVLELAPGLKISVSECAAVAGKFEIFIFGARGKYKYDTIDEAKIAAEGMASDMLKTASTNLAEVIVND